MPLSEHEQNLLSQLEQQLVAEDPRFASAMRGSRGGPRNGRRLALGALGVVAGLALILAAVVQQWLLLAVPGFLLMIAGATYAISRPALSEQAAQQAGGGAARAPRRGPANPSAGGVFTRLEQRFDRRRDEDESRG